MITYYNPIVLPENAVVVLLNKNGQNCIGKSLTSNEMKF